MTVAHYTSRPPWEGMRQQLGRVSSCGSSCVLGGAFQSIKGWILNSDHVACLQDLSATLTQTLQLVVVVAAVVEGAC